MQTDLASVGARTRRGNVRDPAQREIQDFVRDLLHQEGVKDEVEQRITKLASRYSEIRSKLAMANLRLVAHVARKYRNRGISSSDLLQEGFCGLLKAIDRFEPDKETRLASYAVWWIRQSLQRAVAAGDLSRSPQPPPSPAACPEQFGSGGGYEAGPEAQDRGAASTIEQIHSATRPTVSLNANLRPDEGSCLINALTYPAREDDTSSELDEYLVVMMKQLKPREQVVLQLRYGLGGQECHSLSQVSEVLDVSKERIRQIQEGGLEKLRSLARGKALCEATG